MSSHRIVSLDPGQIDRVGPLWKEMVAHHRQVVEGEWPVRSEEEAWRRRRLEYAEVLGEEGGKMFAAVPAEDPEAAPGGYATLTVRRSGATWEMGDRVGEIESLAVAAPQRGQGIGSMLIEACREALRAEGIAYWGVGVVEANEDATRLYERAGFRPYYRLLKARVRDGG